MTRVRGWIVALSVLNLVLFTAGDVVGGEELKDCCQEELDGSEFCCYSCCFGAPTCIGCLD